MNTLANSERETHFNIMADDRSTVHIFSDDPVMQRRIEKVGATIVKVEANGGKHYTLPASHLSLRKPRKLTEAQREKLSKRMRSIRKNQIVTSKSRQGGSVRGNGSDERSSLAKTKQVQAQNGQIGPI